MGVAVISRNYAYTQRSFTATVRAKQMMMTLMMTLCVCEMNDKRTCSGFKKYGNTAAATPLLTQTHRGRYMRHAWEYATVFVPTLIELHLQ